MTDIPPALIESVKLNQAVLFLGAGASFGATHPEGARAPAGQDLAERIAGRFLGGDFVGRPLNEISELAVSETDLFRVQDYIASIFEPFQPADFHKLVATFPWFAIATTNYDLIIERAYEEKSRVQDLVKFLRNSDRVENRLRASPRSVPFLKLHGCITETRDQDLPLILTVDQYINYKSGRSLLFERLEEWARSYPFIFVGYKLADPNLRQMLLRISGLGDARPRSYLVSPGLQPAEIGFWGQRKITCIQTTFQEFLEDLDRAIPAHARQLGSLAPPEIPGFERALKLAPSEALRRFLSTEVDVLHPAFATGPCDAKAFYGGAFVDWAPIAHNLDVQRRVTMAVLADSIFDDADAADRPQQFYLVKGHAGSGKTVALHRAAWEAGVNLGAQVLFLRRTGSIHIDAFRELLSKAPGRIYLFVDNVVQHRGEIEAVLRISREERAPLTVVGATREAIWNRGGASLTPFVSKSYEMRYLSVAEIRDLLKKLEEHRSLGSLEPLEGAERMRRLEHRAGRQLLVALHEATLGRPFAEIVLEEYEQIPDTRARSLYLTVAILHRLGVPARAGLISRIHGIPFTEFREHLFLPLERIVSAQHDGDARDYVYLTRHQHIAEILFERALVEPGERRDEYVRLVTSLDTGYRGDQAALRGLTNAKQLVRLFEDHEMRRSILAAAILRFPGDAALLQQQGILEMTAREGDIERAAKALQEAQNLSPQNPAILHSRAELALKLANRARTDIEKTRWRAESRRLAENLIAMNGDPSRAFHTLLKVELVELEEVLHSTDAPTVERHVRKLERSLRNAHERLGGDSYLLDADAKFSQLLDNQPRALDALKSAFGVNPASGYLALRLARLWVYRKDSSEAEQVLRRCLEANPAEPDVQFALGKLLADEGRLRDAKGYLRASFTEGDAQHEARFHYARTCFVLGEYDEASRVFGVLRRAEVPYERRSRVRLPIRDAQGHPKRFGGTIEVRNETSGQVKDDATRQRIFFSAKRIRDEDWGHLQQGVAVEYHVGFNYMGAIAYRLKRPASGA